MDARAWITRMVALIGCCLSPMLHAETFLQVYSQALQSDPAFLKAEANWRAQKLNLPITRAGYLPQLAVAGNAVRSYTFYAPASLSEVSDYNWNYGYSITLTQPIFDLAAWHAIKGASASVKSATATYLAAQQQLMQRTAQAYFEVLKAYETLIYTNDNKEAVWKQYLTAKRKYEAGLIAVMDMYDARSRYDFVIAQEISAKNTLSDKLENLHALTGHYYKTLNGFSIKIPLVQPNPRSVDAWTKASEAQNYSIQEQRFNVIAAMDNIKQQVEAGYPTLDLSTGFVEARAVDNQNDSTNTDAVNLGLNLTYKPIQGGLVYTSTEQARYYYAAAAAELELVHRQVVIQARNSYVGVMAMMNRVNTDRARIVSANKALVATEAGLKVGARTMLDLLNDLTTLYQAQQQLADDRYTYLTNVINLKAAAGTLKMADIMQINHWLQKKIALPSTSFVDVKASERQKQ